MYCVFKFLLKVFNNLNIEMASNKKLSSSPPASPMLLIVGGCSDSLERGALCTCELFSVPDLCPLPNFPSTNLARRAPALYKFNKSAFVLGGCSGPGAHLKSAEFIQFNGENWEEWKNCDETEASDAFSCASFCQFRDGTAFAFGGFDGLHCMRQSLLVRPPTSLPYAPTVQPLAPLPYALKNGVAIAMECPDDSGSEAQQQRHICWLVGGWDGHRTLKTVFEYSSPEGKCSLKHLLPYSVEGHSIAQSTIVAPQMAFISGGFDGIGLRADFVAMDLRNCTAESIKGIGLERARENHCSVIFGDGKGREWLAIVGGWDGTKSLSNWEIFEILPNVPWLRRADIGPWGEKAPTLATARNRAAAIQI